MLRPARGGRVLAPGADGLTVAVAVSDADAFEADFRRHARAIEAFAGARAVVVAASGGLDSMTLLHLLRHCGAAPEGAQLHAAHFDHAMRPESDADARWVASVCREWGVPVHVGRAAEPVRTEAEGRELRYRFLEETRRSLAVAKAVVATAHTADDQAETVLFRIARGSGPGGLAGVRPWRAPGVARPLLPFWRKQLRAFARSRSVPFRDDPSNHDSRWVRNRLRRTVLPALEEAVPGASAALAAHAEISRLQSRALNELLDERIARLTVPADPARLPSPALSLDRDALLLLSDTLLPHVLRRAAARAGSDLGRNATAALVRFARQSQSGKRMDLPGGVVAEISLGRLHFLPARSSAPSSSAARSPAPCSSALPPSVRPSSAIPAPAPCSSAPSPAAARPPAPSPPAVSPVRRVDVASPAGEASYAHAGFQVRVAWGPSRLPAFPHVASFGVAGPSLQLVVRPWKPGDRVAMPYGRKKVKKLLLEARVPRPARAAAPVVAVPGGPVLWVPGAMAAPKVEDPLPRRVLYVHVSAPALPAPPLPA